MDVDSTLTYLHRPLHRCVRKAMALAAIGLYLAYLVYRALFTLNPEAIVFSTAIYFAELHGFLSLIFYYFQVWELRGRTVAPCPLGLSVDVFITTYNEDLPLLRQTVRGALNMRHPHRTFVLDDGRRPEVEALCAELGCDYITRATNEHAKAGNWNNAFAQTTGAVIATFDADHVPRADFLERTLGFFSDPEVGFVQVPQRYHNLDSLQHRVSWKGRRLYGEQDVFFNLVMPGKDHWNASFFCGTGAVLRRAALEPHGGLLTGSITEDMYTALQLQTEGWKSVYLNELLVTGLAPMDFSSYSSQRLRWAEGNLKIIQSINPLTCRGLTFAQRVCYFASMYHWTIGVPKVVFYLAPPVVLFTGQFPIANFDSTFLAFYGAHLLSLIISYRIVSGRAGRIVMDEVFNMANFWTLVVAVKRLVLGRGESTFVVTSKWGDEGGRHQAVLPQYFLIAATVMALVWGGLGLGFGATEDLFGIGIISFWAVFNLALLLVVASFARRPAQKRQSVRFRTAVPIELRDALVPASLAVSLDMSETGCTLASPRCLDVNQLSLRLHLGSETLDCEGRVVATHGRQKNGWFAYGIQFERMPPRHGDRLADALFNMTVPEIFASLSQPSLAEKIIRTLRGRIASAGRHARRREAFLPLRVRSGGGEFVATTRELSQSGLSLTAPRPLDIDSHVTLELQSPDDQWVASATVVRVEPLEAPLAAYRTWQVGLRLDGQSEVVGLRQILSDQAA